ncbi:MAG: MBL fold metallo-hydrolase [Pirellulales bacterium]|nr:MBL fold metallo-hydrolase [Pirellulales bacterium]
MKQPELQVNTIFSVPFGENCYVARLEGRNDCLVVDPGLEPHKIIEFLDEQGLVPAAILNTHGHLDHIAGNATLKQRWPDCPLVIGSGEAAKLTDARANLSTMVDMAVVSPPADITVEDGETYSAAGLDLTVLLVPGHSRGHVAYLVEDHDPPVVFVGDLIMAGSIGRTDFPDGDGRQLVESIHSKLFTLPDETLLLSGHGSRTTVGQEKRSNPFVGLQR